MNASGAKLESSSGGRHADPLWRLALAGGRHRSVEEGATLFEQGEGARCVYFVISGRLDVFRKDGKWRVIWSRGDGDILSFDCAGRRELSCQAAVRTELIVVERDVLLHSAEHDSGVAGRLEQFNGEELRIVLSTLGDVSHMSGADVIELNAARSTPVRPSPKSGSRRAATQRGARHYGMASN